MNRIETLFKHKNNNILSVYFTAGHPTMQSVVPIIKALENSGADLIEIGFPFSDPLADGPVIQKSSQTALENGMTLKILFDTLTDIRQQSQIPLLLMGYFNTVLQFGVENFCRQASKIGIDGVILPDLPLEVYEREYKAIFEQYGFFPVFLISPNTSNERIIKAVSLSKGFVYAVSSAATTGVKQGFSTESEAYFKRLHDMKLDLPVLIGFGISNRETFAQVCKYHQGAIVGSAFVKAIENEEYPEKAVAGFIAGLR